MADPILRAILITEAVNSVALSHAGDDCACTACRAAGGDARALGEIMEALAGRRS